MPKILNMPLFKCSVMRKTHWACLLVLKDPLRLATAASNRAPTAAAAVTLRVRLHLIINLGKVF